MNFWNMSDSLGKGFQVRVFGVSLYVYWARKMRWTIRLDWMNL